MTNYNELAEFLEDEASVLEFASAKLPKGQGDWVSCTNRAATFRQCASAFRSVQTERTATLREVLKLVDEAIEDNWVHNLPNVIRALLTTQPKAEPVKPEGETEATFLDWWAKQAFKAGKHGWYEVAKAAWYAALQSRGEGMKLKQFFCRHKNLSNAIYVSGIGYTEYEIKFCCRCDKLIWRQTINNP